MNLCNWLYSYNSLSRLLVGLTVPVECLVCVDTSNQSPTSQHIVHELTQLLYNAKEAFLDPRATRAVIDHVHRLLEKVETHDNFTHFTTPVIQLLTSFFVFLSNRCRVTTVNQLIIRYFSFETFFTLLNDLRTWLESEIVRRRQLRLSRAPAIPKHHISVRIRTVTVIQPTVRSKIDCYGTYSLKDSIGFLLTCWPVHRR